MSRSGTLVICVQNLDFSGANQVVLNIVSGRVHQSNVVVLSPKVGAFAARFVDSGASVRVGDLETLLFEIRDVFCVICNTIMTAPIVVDLANSPYPVVWILHEWWDDEAIVENLRMRNYQNMTLATVKLALEKASLCVFVCESQRQLYKPTAPSAVIFVGVPDPLPRYITSRETETLKSLEAKGAPLVEGSWRKDKNVFTFLCLGIICPRKNQLWTVKLFKQFAKDKPNARLKVVGARYTRDYEVEYLEKVKAEVDGDERIEILDVTDNVDPFYQIADALILTSLNEVTPMVISEALSWSIPVLSTNIAGIGEMYRDGEEGFLFAPDDDAKALAGMEAVYGDAKLRQKMSVKARARFESTFDINVMVDGYKQLMLEVAPPVILLDMDGVLVDWDKGFLKAWGPRCPIDRTISYYMEDCLLDMSLRKEALQLIAEKGFFANLDPMEGALEALKEMLQEGLQLFICTSPIKHSRYCAQEKIDWVVKHLGEEWVDRIIICHDKSTVLGDILIDDKPMCHLNPRGKHTAAKWKQIVFDAPYNRQVNNPRLYHWRDWRHVLYPMLGKSEDSIPMSASASQESLRESIMRGRGTSDALLAGYQIPTMDMPPTGRPIGLLKLHRGTSIGSESTGTEGRPQSLLRGRTGAEVQHDLDMLQTDTEPLSPEAIATIISGSASLMNDNDSPTHRDQQKATEYRKGIAENQRKMALDSDEQESEGLQLFRGAFEFWNRAMTGRAK